MSAKDNLGWTVLMCAAAMGDKEMVKFLTTKKAQLDAKDNNGMTALMWAVVENRKEVIKLLTTKKAQLDAKDNNGKTVLMWALEKNDKVMVKFFINKGADVNAVDSEKHTILIYAVRYTDIETVKLLFSISPLTPSKCSIQKSLVARDSEGYHSLLIAIEKGDKEIVEFLIAEGVKTNGWSEIKGQKKISHLEMALSLDKFEIAKLLVDNMQEVSNGSHPKLWEKIALQISNLEQAIDVIYCIVAKYHVNTKKGLLGMKDAALKYAQYCKQNAVQDKDNVLKVQKNCINSFSFIKNFEKTFSELKKVDKEWIKKLFDAEHEKNDTQVIEKMQKSLIKDLVGSVIVDYCDHTSRKPEDLSTNYNLSSI